MSFPVRNGRSSVMSPTSPTSPSARMRSSSRHSQRQVANSIPPGFISGRPKRRPISELTLRELYDLRKRNAHLLSNPGASTSTYHERVTKELVEIEARLVEIEGMDHIQTGLKQARIKGEEDMEVDQPPEPPASRILEAKRKALSRFGAVNGATALGSISVQEAVELEQKAHALDEARREAAKQKKIRLGLPIKGEVLTKQEKEARIWAFMNHKPTESDLEDDSDDDSDEDPSGWFEDDQEDGVKGQNIIEPDAEDWSSVIRVDETRATHYNTFYEPRD